MNDTIRIEQRPEVREFVAAVRARLTDLTEEEREELVGGLEADMADLVAERGVEVLPDPAEYAAELRSAAGFSPVATGTSGSVRDTRDRMMAWLDRGGATWRRWVESKDHLGVPAFVHALRPAWWVLRALVAAMLASVVTGVESAVLAVAFTVMSVQIGRGAWWPGTVLRRSLALRFVMVVLNVFALLLLPAAFDRFMSANGHYVYGGEPVSMSAGDGLSYRGEPVANIYPYDASGHLLTGVQLVDRQGRRLSVTQNPYDEGTGWGEFVHAPWMNGRTELYSVFPLPEQKLDPDTQEPVGEARLQSPPLASLPPVNVAGVQPSVLVPPATVEARRKAAVEQAEKRAEARRKALRAKRDR